MGDDQNQFNITPEHMHRDERQHKPENTIMEEDNEQQGQDSGCDTAACYAAKIYTIQHFWTKEKKR